MLKKITLLILIVFCVILIGTSILVFAQAGPAGGGQGAGPAGGGISIPNPLQAKNFPELIDSIVTFLLEIGLAISTIVIIVAAIMFMTAGGSEQRVTRAKRTLLWAVVGMAILLVAKGVTSIITSFLQ